MLPDHAVFVIDDDENLRASVCALAASMGCRAKGFVSAEEFLADSDADARGVIVLDLHMPGMGGLAFLEELGRRKSHLPVVVLTAYARTAITVRAMQAGAVTLIDKPYYDDELWDAIRTGLRKEDAAWAAAKRRRDVSERLAALTAEERNVMELIVEGMPNKAIAQELGLAIRTIEKRRHEVLAKMKADSVAELVKLAIETRNA